MGNLEKPEQPLLSAAGSLEELVAAIRRLPPGRDTYEPGRGSLATALAAQPANPDFDLQAWNEEWARVEAEMARIEAEDNTGL